MRLSPSHHQRLWQIISRIPSLRAPRQLWQAELGDQWALCSPLLRATPALATWTLPGIGHSPCEVIRHADGTFVAVDRLQGETFDVARDDLLVYRLDMNVLFTQLMILLGGKTRFDAAKACALSRDAWDSARCASCQEA